MALFVAAAGLWFAFSDHTDSGIGEQKALDKSLSASAAANLNRGSEKTSGAGAANGLTTPRREVAAAAEKTPPNPSGARFERPPTGAPSTAPAAVLPPPPPEGAGGRVVSRDFEKIKLMLRDYRTLMGENPVGTNAEIMKAITGANQKGAKLGPPDGMSLNNFGELVDPWGTPFFFHQVSGTQMEIRSAGQDRKMWTADDIVSK